MSCKSCKAVVVDEVSTKSKLTISVGGRKAILGGVASPFPINHYGSHLLPLKWSPKIVPSQLTMKVISKLHEGARRWDSWG